MAAPDAQRSISAARCVAGRVRRGHPVLPRPVRDRRRMLPTSRPTDSNDRPASSCVRPGLLHETNTSSCRGRNRSRELLDQIRRRASAGSFAAAQAASSRGARPQRRVGQRALDRQRASAAASRRRRGTAHADAGPVDARGVLVHVAGGRAPRPRRSPTPARAPACRARRGRRRRRSAASSARRRPTRPAARWPGTGDRLGRRAAVPRAPARAPAGRPALRSAARSSVLLGVLRRRRRHEHERARRPAAARPRRTAAPTAAARPLRRRIGPARGYSSCGNVATRASSREIPPCT